MIKAIETRYKGYRFRSRLEARWAVFFDALGYQWEYEPEGFDLGDGVYYLPDFRVTGTDTNGDEMNYWFEVKPKGVPLTASAVEKLERFSSAMGDNIGYAGSIILLSGAPDESSWYTSFSCPQFVYVLWSHRMRPWWEIAGEHESMDEYLKELDCLPGTYHMARHHGKTGNWVEHYRSAIKKARSARFEHGETP